MINFGKLYWKHHIFYGKKIGFFISFKLKSLSSASYLKVLNSTYWLSMNKYWQTLTICKISSFLLSIGTQAKIWNRSIYSTDLISILKYKIPHYSTNNVPYVKIIIVQKIKYKNNTTNKEKILNCNVLTLWTSYRINNQ